VTRVDDLARFDQLFADHMDAVLAYALARTDPESAKDAAADAFLVAWRRIHEVPDPARAWLLGVTRRTLAGQHRSRRRQRQLVERIVALGEVMRDQLETVPEIAGRSVLARALAGLRSRDRELLCLIAWDGLSNAEAAEVLKCSQNALGVRLHRARGRFETALADEAAKAEAEPSSFTGEPSVIDLEVPHGEP
jgi:RNA polymerase sigma factor (sigma-70 family)